MTTLLYRSPNVIIDAVTFHVTVRRNCRGKIVTTFFWRRSEREKWQQIRDYPGRLPKGIWRFFNPYKRSIMIATGELPQPGPAFAIRNGKPAIRAVAA